MSNVLHFSGAMHPRRALPVQKLTEAELDAQIAANRERVAEVFEAAERAQAPKARTSARRRPSLIPLDHSLRGRLIRWLRALSLQLRSPL